MVLIYKVLFPSISTFETPLIFVLTSPGVMAAMIRSDPC
jgi:hypothetical protein